MTVKSLRDYFALFVHGDGFDVDDYLSSASLVFDEIWRKGEQRPVCVDSGYETSGVRKYLGDATRLSIEEQDRIAVDFVEANRQQLRHLFAYPGAKYRLLGLQHPFKVDDGTLGFAIGPSARLMSLALDLGFEITYYVTVEPPSDDEGVAG
jgi:hypothetical protein